MTKWLGGIRGAILMVLIWIVGWSLGFGGLAEAFVDPSGKTLDIWPAEMSIPGFVGGVVFAALLLTLERERHFDEVTLARFTLLGVITGLVLAVLSNHHRRPNSAFAQRRGDDRPRRGARRGIRRGLVDLLPAARALGDTRRRSLTPPTGDREAPTRYALPLMP